MYKNQLEESPLAEENDDQNEMLFPLDDADPEDHQQYLRSTLVISPFKEAGF